MMLKRSLGVVLREGEALEYIVADPRVLTHRGHLIIGERVWLLQQCVRDAQLAYVMHIPATLDCFGFLL